MQQTDLQLTTGGKKENRRELDFYPTPPECTIALMNFLKLDPCTIWEPAVGDGAMAFALSDCGMTVFGTDIRHGHDYLTTEPSRVFDAVITNPPFNLSEQFIRKALTEAPLVAMLLKSQYWPLEKPISLP